MKRSLITFTHEPEAVFRDADKGGGTGTGTAEADPVASVEKSLKAIEKQNAEILGNMSKDMKKALEEIEAVKKDNATLSERVVALQKANVALANERRSFTTGRDAIIGSEEKSARLIGAIAKAMNIKPSPAIQSALKALGEDSSPGSTLIDDKLAGDIYDSLLRYGAWRTLGVMPVSTKQTKNPVTTARPAANFVLTEAATISADSTKAGTSVTLEVEVIAALINVSMQIIQDGEFDIAGILLDELTEALNERFDYACFQGDGTADATNGGITGVFGFGTQVTAVTTHTTVATTTYTDWLLCLTGIDAAVLTRNAQWWEHPLITAASLGVKDSNGRPIFQTALEAPNAKAIGSRFGFPINAVGKAPSTDAAGGKLTAFGDPRAFAVGVRKDATVEESDHAGWTTFQRSFRAIMRAGAVGRKASALTVLKTAAS